MLVKSVAAFAALTFAANVAAEPMPYQPSMMKASSRSLFGVVRRQELGYQPEQAVCGAGATCEQACGAGYTTCSSTDSQVHCFNPAAGEVCCPNKSGSKSRREYESMVSADLLSQTRATPDTTAHPTPRARRGAAPRAWTWPPAPRPTPSPEAWSRRPLPPRPRPPPAPAPRLRRPPPRRAALPSASD